MRRRLLTLAATLLIALSATPAAAKKQKQTPAAEDEILVVNRDMAKFLVEQVGGKQARRVRLQVLLRAIFSKDGLDIRYGNTRTRTASETYSERSGNCLSFTLMFVAMARHLGLEAYFAEVSEVLSWDQRGELVLSNRHMFAEVELDNGVRRIDFLPGPEKRYREITRISDARARAHYYNNLGAEALVDGDPERAVGLFDRALAADPTLVTALVNQGLAWRKLGDFEASERAYRRALELEPGELAALSNLVGLYLAHGFEAEAEPYRRRVDDYLKRNPYHHFRLGVRSAELGDAPGAIRHLREAIRRLPDEAEFYAVLADVYERGEELAKARENFTKALRLAEDDGQRRRLSQRLAALGDDG